MTRPRLMLLAGAAVLLALLAAVLLRPHPVRQVIVTPAPIARPAPAPSLAPSPAPAPGTAPAAGPAAADCTEPTNPPPMPDGATASRADMHAAHQTIQAFVQRLEDYQTCRNNQVDHAAPMVTEALRDHWIDQGNNAVDQANALAHAFSVQIEAFKAHHPGQ